MAKGIPEILLSTPVTHLEDVSNMRILNKCIEEKINYYYSENITDPESISKASKSTTRDYSSQTTSIGGPTILRKVFWSSLVFDPLSSTSFFFFLMFFIFKTEVLHITKSMAAKLACVLAPS